ncbi:MAG: hypothetical protein ABI400_02545 [Lacisediminihabitans sp.]
MNRDDFDVSVIWKRPLWPITVVVVLIEIICIPLSLNPRYGVVVQIFGPVLLLSWFVVALVLSARIRRRGAGR